MKLCNAWEGTVWPWSFLSFLRTMLLNLCFKRAVNSIGDLQFQAKWQQIREDSLNRPYQRFSQCNDFSSLFCRCCSPAPHSTGTSRLFWTREVHQMYVRISFYFPIVLRREHTHMVKKTKIYHGKQMPVLSNLTHLRNNYFKPFLCLMILVVSSTLLRNIAMSFFLALSTFFLFI